MKHEQISEETFTISEMCKDFKVTARTLRFYESKELLFPIREKQKRLESVERGGAQRDFPQTEAADQIATKQSVLAQGKLDKNEEQLTKRAEKKFKQIDTNSSEDTGISLNELSAAMRDKQAFGAFSLRQEAPPHAIDSINIAI